MSMKQNTANQQSIPVEIAGSTKFGRYPKISIEQTFNMMISDNWLVPYPGYKNIINTNGLVGRAIYTSSRLGKMIAVIDNNVYVINNNLSKALIGTIDTFEGDVFIDENITYQIAITDKKDIWIYNWALGTFTKDTLDFQPGYITYQDSRFIVPNIETANNPSTWRLSEIGDGTIFPNDAQHVGALQTKSDYAIATLRFPGRGNLLLLFGKTVTEFQQDVGGQLFPYQKNTSFNIDYGCINPATIAANKNIVCWLGFNEKSGLAILYTDGSTVQKISTDGIDFKLGQVQNPLNTYGFLFEQYGHIFYQLTFADPQDNFTYTYDFNLQKFYTLTDEHMNYHIAKRLAFFNDTYYFVSINDGNIYELNSNYTTYDYGNGKIYEIPRIRIPPTYRSVNSSYFVVNSLTFPIEQGTDVAALGEDLCLATEDGIFITTENPATLLNNYMDLATENDISLCTEDGIDISTTPPFNELLPHADTGMLLSVLNYGSPYEYAPRVDLSVSRNGGESFGSIAARILNPVGKYRNRLVWWQLGAANEITFQFRFVGTGRFVATNGEMVIYR